MKTAIKLHDTHMVKPQMGLDLAKGVITVLGIMTSDVAPEWAVEPYTQGFDEEEEWSIRAMPWIAFKYEDAALHKDYGIMYLPKEEFEYMIK